MGHVARGLSRAMVLPNLLYDFKERISGARRAEKG